MPELIKFTSADTAGATSLDGNISATAKNMLIAVFATRNATHSVSGGWIFLGDGSVITASGTTQYLSFAYKIADGNDKITVSAGSSGRIYLLIAEISGATNAELVSGFNSTNTAAGTLTPNAQKASGDSVIWGITWPLTADGFTCTTSPNDITTIQPNYPTANRLFAAFDNGNGAVSRTFTSPDAAGIGGIKLTNAINHKSYGSALYTRSGLTGVVKSFILSWREDNPIGTSVAVSAGTDGINYAPVANGGAIFPEGTELTNATLYMKVELSTTNTSVTPSVSGLRVTMQTSADANCVVLEMEPLQRFESAAGAITVDYDGAGTLAGAGGAVKAFAKAFAPAGLVPKPDQNDAEHLELSVAAAGTLTRIYYRDAKEEEHIELSVSAVGKLTNIKDI